MKSKLLQNLKALYQSELITITLKNSTQVLLRFIIGMINIKITSIWLGTSGMALMGQFTNFVQITGNLSGGGINQGVIKLTSQYSNTETRKNIVISNSVFAVLFLSIITSVLSFSFAQHLSLTILKSPLYFQWFRAGGVIIFSFSFSNALLAILNGLKNYKLYIWINVSIAISTLIITVPFTYFWRLEGAIAAQYVAGVLNVLLTSFLCRKLLFEALSKYKFSKHIIKRLFVFGLMLVIASSISPIVSIIIRNKIISAYSIDMAGWWDGISRISKTFFGLCVTTLSLYYLPKISKQQPNKELNHIIWNTVKISMPIIIIVITTIYLSKNLIINTLFTDEFNGMEDLFLFQSIGDAFRIFNWFFAITFVIKEKINLYIVSEIIMAFIYISLIYILIPIVGIKNCTLPYMINTIIYFGITQFIYRKYII